MITISKKYPNSWKQILNNKMNWTLLLYNVEAYGLGKVNTHSIVVETEVSTAIEREI